MKWPITLVATVLLSSVRVAAAQGGAAATNEDFLAAPPPRAEQTSDLRAQAVAGSPARTIAVVWVLMMMTVIVYRRLGRRAL